MSLVPNALAKGRLSLAVSGALLRDADVALALRERAALQPMTLSGTPSSPVIAVSDAGLVRALSDKGGVVVLVDPQEADQPDLQRLAQRVMAAGTKPTIVVVAQRFDGFRMQFLFPKLKVEHIKERGPAFLKSMPLPPEDLAPAAAPAVEKKKATDDAPRLVFVGRDEELETLSGLLSEGGPLVLSGAPGTGRSTLIEHAVVRTGLQRLPDLTLGRGVGADALLARIAEIGRQAGVTTLADVLMRPHQPAEAIEAAITTLQAAESTAQQLFVVVNLQSAAGRAGDFFRKSRLELLLEALLRNTYPLRLVFLSSVQPVFYREGAGQHLRRMVLEGLKGRFLHEIFQAYGAPEFPRDHFGRISEKIFGHPIAARFYALALQGNLSLLEDDKFFRMSDAGDITTLGKQIERRLERTEDGLRRPTAYLAHLRYPVDGQVLADLGIPKKLRNALLSAGLLEMVGTPEGTKRFRVHPVVARAFPERMVADFEIYRDVAAAQRTRARDTVGVERLALLQEANRCVLLAHNNKDVSAIDFPDHDALIETATGLIRARTNPRYDLAEQRIAEVLKANPGNADAHLLKLELLRRTNAKPDVWKAALDAALEQAPVPEIFHEAVAHHQARNARAQAITVLEDAVRLFPDQSRLRCRLAALLHRQGRRPEAIEQLKLARDADPLLPDAYGLLGTIYREEGVDRVFEAEELLREAVRLAPGDVVQTGRLVWLLLDIHHGVPERREGVAAELKELLDGLVQADKQSWEAHLYYAVALREMGGDLSRAAWFLGKARKLAPRAKGVEARVDLERALLDVAAGKLDEAERALHKLEKADPSNHRVVAGLARIAEARGHHVVAHAEYVRAAERTSPFSLDRTAYEMELARLVAILSGDVPMPMPAAAAAQAPALMVPEEEEASAAEESAEPVQDEDDRQVEG